MSKNAATSSSKKRLIFVARLFLPFALGYFLADLYRSVNAVLAPALMSEFHLAASQLGFMTSAYFLGFALIQLPLGIALDRYGARHTLAVTLLFGAAGSVMFAVAPNIAFLAIGRALIGMGVGGCLMSALKAFADSVSYRKLPIMNSLLTFVGGIGVMTATKPLYFSLQFVDWRGVFVILAIATVVTSVLILVVSPKTAVVPNQHSTIKQELTGFLFILKSPGFLRIIPLATFVQATYLSLDTLWVGTWFKDIPQFDASQVSTILLVVSVALTAGYLMNGLVGGALRRYGFDYSQTAITAIIVFTALLAGLAIVTPLNGAGGVILWPLMIFLGPFVLLVYPLLTNMFDSSLTGRALTLYNLMVFVVSFLFQYCLGLIIDIWPPTADGRFNATGYTAGLWIIFGLHAASLIWYFFAYRQKANRPSELASFAS